MGMAVALGEGFGRMDHATSGHSKDEYESLAACYRARFGAFPPVYFMPEQLAVAVMRDALRRGEPAPPEPVSEPGCNCR